MVLPGLNCSFPVYIASHILGWGQVCHLWGSAPFSFKYPYVGNWALSLAPMVDIFTGGPESLPPCGATCTLAHVCDIIATSACVCGWLAWILEQTQSAGISVNSVVSCAPHTSGMSSPFIRHEMLWRRLNWEEARRGKSGWIGPHVDSRNRPECVTLNKKRNWRIQGMNALSDGWCESIDCIKEVGIITIGFTFQPRCYFLLYYTVRK